MKIDLECLTGILGMPALKLRGWGGDLLFEAKPTSTFCRASYAKELALPGGAGPISER